MSGSMVGGVDASIPLQAGKGVPQFNPLQQIGQFANTANSLNQLKLFPGQRQLQQQAVQSGATSLAKLNNQAVYDALIPWTSLKADQKTPESLATALASAQHNLGLVTGGVSQDFLDTIPPGDPDFADKASRMVLLRAQTDPATGAQMATGTPTVMHQGQFEQPGVVGGLASQNFGAFQPKGAALPLYPSTATNMAQVQWQSPDGTIKSGTAAQRAADLGIPPPALGPGSGVPGSGEPLAPHGASAPPQSGPGVVGTQGPVSPQNPPRLTGGIPGAGVGPTPGTTENEVASAGAAHAANVRATTFPSDMYPLLQAQTALQTAPSGYGSQAVHDASSYINTFAPAYLQKALSFVYPIMSKDEVAAYDVAKKMLTQGQLGQTGAARSDAGLTTAGAASPSVNISKEAAQFVLKGMIGLRRMEQSTVEFNNSGLPPAEYDKFMTHFATTADPHVYTFDQITPQQRQAYIASLKTPAQQNAFRAAVANAEQNGILTAPGAGQ